MRRATRRLKFSNAHASRSNKPRLVASRVGHACFFEPATANRAGIAGTACTAECIRLIARHSGGKVQPQTETQLDYPRFAQVQQRRLNDYARSVKRDLGRQIRHALEGSKIFRATIRVARIVDRICADVDIRRFEYFSPSQGERQKYRIAGRHICDGHSAVERCACIGHVNRIAGQCRAAERA